MIRVSVWCDFFIGVLLACAVYAGALQISMPLVYEVFTDRGWIYPAPNNRKDFQALLYNEDTLFPAPSAPLQGNISPFAGSPDPIYS